MSEDFKKFITNLTSFSESIIKSTFITKLKSFISITIRLVFILLGLFFIYNNDLYKISLNLPTWLIGYKGLVYLDYFFSYAGTLFLFIPVTIVIASFMFESKVLRFIALFFSFCGNLMQCVTWLRYNATLELTRFRLFTIYHAQAFEDKKNSFKKTFEFVANADYGLSQKQADIINSKFNLYFEGEIQHKIKSLPLSDIPQYAKSIFDRLKAEATQELNFNNTLLPNKGSSNVIMSTLSNISPDIYVKLFFGLVAGVVIYKIYQGFFTNNDLQNVGTDTADTLQSQHAVNANVTLVGKLNKTLIDKTTDEVISNTRGLGEALKLVHANIKKLRDVVDHNGSILQKVCAENPALQTTLNTHAAMLKNIQSTLGLLQIEMKRCAAHIPFLEEKIGAVTSEYMRHSHKMENENNSNTDTAIETFRDQMRVFSEKLQGLQNNVTNIVNSINQNVQVPTVVLNDTSAIDTLMPQINKLAESSNSFIIVVNALREHVRICQEDILAFDGILNSRFNDFRAEIEVHIMAIKDEVKEISYTNDKFRDDLARNIDNKLQEMYKLIDSKLQQIANEYVKNPPNTLTEAIITAAQTTASSTESEVNPSTNDGSNVQTSSVQSPKKNIGWTDTWSVLHGRNTSGTSNAFFVPKGPKGPGGL